MADRTSRGALAALSVVLALSGAALAVAWGSGSWTAKTSAGRPAIVTAWNGQVLAGNSLARWCSAEPGELQQSLRTSMGTPIEQGSPGHGQEMGLNVTPQGLLSLEIAMVPMHASEGYAVWKHLGYLLADTYSTAGSIDRMYAWPIDMSANGKLPCAPERGTPFGPVMVPNVVGQTVSNAEVELHAANLIASIPAISNVWLKSVTVRLQNPTAGTSTIAGTSVRLNPFLRGVLSFVYGGLTLQPAGAIATLGVSKQEAIATYRQHSPGPRGAPTAVLLGYVTSHGGAHPVLHHRLVWVVEYKHARIQLYGPGARSSTVGTWIGVVDAHTGQYLTTQNFGWS